MLYDPRWSGPTVAELVAWLETKNPAEAYEWLSADCLYGIYGRETGKEFNNPVHYYDISLPKPHTFGAALERARQYL